MSNGQSSQLSQSLPDDLTLYVEATTLSAADLADLIAGSLASGELRSVEQWSLPAEAKAKGGDWRAALDKHSRANVGRAIGGRLHLGGGQRVDFSSKGDAIKGEDRTRWRVMLHTTPDKAQPSSYAALLESHARFCRYWLRKGSLDWGLLYWTGGGAQCLPKVPLAGDRSHLVVTTQAQVEASYDRPDVFWDAGWSSMEQFGEMHLVLRAIDITSSVDYLRQVQPHQWALARAAKPKKTSYYLPNPLPEELAVLNSGEGRLQAYGYHEALKRIEYTCLLEGDAHIPGWEILGLYQLLRAGAMPDGRPLERARVLFYEEWMARQEMRPLLDIGVQVSYLSPDGTQADVEDFGL